MVLFSITIYTGTNSSESASGNSIYGSSPFISFRKLARTDSYRLWTRSLVSSLPETHSRKSAGSEKFRFLVFSDLLPLFSVMSIGIYSSESSPAPVTRRSRPSASAYAYSLRLPLLQTRSFSSQSSAFPSITRPCDTNFIKPYPWVSV